ncbi:8552_t:CDS:2 [Ambispora gerdemannii]|uniref:8552_t:CDS:1 n=1 Tax=Ambispora gerdemannii TaxID=144530 RepID=A0A9N9FHH5_9GLOM|nr:8552_t:CDS:2 [Ambispora gerdemannii]
MSPSFLYSFDLDNNKELLSRCQRNRAPLFGYLLPAIGFGFDLQIKLGKRDYVSSCRQTYSYEYGLLGGKDEHNQNIQSSKNMNMSRRYQLIVPKRCEPPPEPDATKLNFAYPRNLWNTWIKLEQENLEIKNRLLQLDGTALSQYRQLHSYELAQLCNLCPVELDEAKMMIPSLAGKFSDEQIREMIDLLKL